MGLLFLECLQPHAWKLHRDDMVWLAASEVSDRIHYMCGDSRGMKETGARRQSGRGQATDGGRDAVAREQQPYRGPLKTAAGL